MFTFQSRRWRLESAMERGRRIQQRFGYDQPLTEKQIRTHMRPRPRRFWLGVAIVLLILSVLFGAPLLTLGALMIASLGIVPEIWYHFSLAGVRFHRSFSERKVGVGEEVILSYRVENRKFLPLPWLEIEDELPASLHLQRVHVFHSHKHDRVILLASMALWLYQRLTRRYRLRPAELGLWVLGPAYVRVGDPFGFLQNEMQIEQLDGKNSLLVYPLVVPITRFGLPSRNPFGDQRTQRRLVEDPSQIIGIRDYQPGDALRRVHWKATARVGTLQSKVYPPTTNYTLIILLNVNTRQRAHEGIESYALELGICAAASVAAWATEHNYAVGLFSNGLPKGGEGVALRSFADTQAFMRVPPSTHPDQLARVLESLARLQPLFGAAMEHVITREETRLPVGATVVYVGAAAAVPPRVVAKLERLRRRGHAVVMLLTGNQPVDVGSIRTLYIGGEEEWHAITQYAHAHGTSESGGIADTQRQRSGASVAWDDGDGADDHAPGDDRRQPAFTLG